MPDARSASSQEAAYMEDLLASVLQHAGWKVEKHPRVGRPIDMLARKGKLAYAIELKRASEGRRDRLLPLMSQAILEAQAAANSIDRQVSPLAVVCARHIPESAAAQVQAFAAENAPGVAVGVLDLVGLRSFVGPGLEVLNQQHRLIPSIILRKEQPQVQLFSGLNQWLLKVMLAPKIPGHLLSAPRQDYRNASELAQAAGVSVMSAFRFVQELKEQGFLEEGPALSLVRLESLIHAWRAAGSKSRELRMRWLIRGDSPERLNRAVHKLLSSPHARDLRRFKLVGPGSAQHEVPPIRVCVGLFAAAELLGVSFVHAGPRYLYVEDANPELFQELGLSRAREGESVDVFVRVPVAKASVFNGAVDVKGVPASDVIQIWLDAAAHPARGAQQADEIWRRVLAPRLGLE